VPIPDFIVELRRAVGNAPLWLAGVTAVTIHDRKLLLVKRSDNGAWTAVIGIVEPGEPFPGDEESTNDNDRTVLDTDSPPTDPPG
jgi:hypothetical protein